MIDQIGAFGGRVEQVPCSCHLDKVKLLFILSRICNHLFTVTFSRCQKLLQNNSTLNNSTITFISKKKNVVVAWTITTTLLKLSVFSLLFSFTGSYQYCSNPHIDTITQVCPTSHPHVNPWLSRIICLCVWKENKLLEYFTEVKALKYDIFPFCINNGWISHGLNSLLTIVSGYFSTKPPLCEYQTVRLYFIVIIPFVAFIYFFIFCLVIEVITHTH